MSEEIKNNGAEINEKELENVSGGYHMWDAYEEMLCDHCDHRNCGKDGFDLYDYINKQKHSMPSRYYNCPYYNNVN